VNGHRRRATIGGGGLGSTKGLYVERNGGHCLSPPEKKSSKIKFWEEAWNEGWTNELLTGQGNPKSDPWGLNPLRSNKEEDCGTGK